jgi:cyclohexanecarboxylate-CoA ligase/acyl-CoA synthetase
MVIDATTHDLTVQDRYDADSIRTFRARGWWQDGSAAERLDHWAVDTPNRPFVSDGTEELTFAEVRARAYRFGARLLELGVRPGDRVVVQLPNWVEFVVAYLGIARIGAVTVPVMTVYRHAEVRHVLTNSGAVAAVTSGTFRGFDHAGMFRELRAEVPALATLIVTRGEALADELAFDAAGAGETPGDDVLGRLPNPDAPHLIVYTSGTESTAKGCVHTWNTIDFSARGLAADVFGMTQDDVMFMPSPIAHATGLLVGILVPLASGSHSHLLDIWEPAEGLRRIARYRCTTTATATPFVRMALDASRTVSADVSSMRFWLCAGAPIPEALAREFGDVFDGGQLVPLYGCTEVLAATCCHLGDPIERMSNSDGTPALPGVRIKLVGLDGDEVSTGEIGEICYWGPGAVLGYWREPQRTSAVIDGAGWHHTGDLGRMDADGYLRVTGRLKDIIIRGGSNISAGEVEGHLLAHPAIRQAAVVAYPDERLGERACAVVVLAEGSELTLPELTAFLRTERRISPQKLPERLVVVAELPMTASGKVQKFKLREIAATG